MRMLKEVNMTENTVANKDNSSEKMKLRYSSYSYSRGLLALTGKHTSKEKLHGRKAKKPRTRRV